jgi:putative inorganic carbon (HCO3(-)) transporter
MNVNDISVVIGILLGVGLAIRGLVRPFLGLLVLMTLHFVQPSEMVPALAPFRLELMYGIFMFAILLRSKSEDIKAIIKTDPIVRGTLLLEFIILITIPFAIWPGGAFTSATELAKMVMLQLLMTFFIDSQNRLRYILWLLVGFMMWFAGSSLSSYLQGQYYVVNGVQRAEGVNSMVGGPNELAGLLLALLPFLVALVRCTKQFLIKLLLFGCGGLTLFVLMLTGARIAMIALLAMAIFYILRSKRKVISLVVGLALGLTLWFSLPVRYQKRYLTVEQYAEGGQLDDSNKLRLEIWDAGRRMFLDHPILGVGAGQFSTAYGMVYSGKTHKAWMQPHNLFLQVTCELGLVGLFAFAYLILQIWKAIREVLRVKKSPSLEINYQFALACNLMMIGIGLVSTVSHTLYRPHWYLLAGMVAANRSVARRILRGDPTVFPEPTELDFSLNPVYLPEGTKATNDVDSSYSPKYGRQ